MHVLKVATAEGLWMDEALGIDGFEGKSKIEARTKVDNSCSRGVTIL